MNYNVFLSQLRFVAVFIFFENYVGKIKHVAKIKLKNVGSEEKIKHIPLKGLEKGLFSIWHGFCFIYRCTKNKLYTAGKYNTRYPSNACRDNLNYHKKERCNMRNTKRNLKDNRGLMAGIITISEDMRLNYIKNNRNFNR